MRRPVDRAAAERAAAERRAAAAASDCRRPSRTPGASGSAARCGTDRVPQRELTLQSMWLQAVRHVMANTDDVGDRFAEEARRIHYGETEERGDPRPGHAR